MKLNNGKEVREALKLRAPNYKWGIYGSMYYEVNGGAAHNCYRRRNILPQDLVKGLFYLENGMDGWLFACRKQVDDIGDENIKYTMYNMGQKSYERVEKKVSAGIACWPYGFIAEEQSDEVLYELYKKNVFAGDYSKKEVAQVVKEYKEREKATADKYRPQVEQAIKDGLARIEFVVSDVRGDKTFYQLEVYIKERKGMSYGFCESKEELHNIHGDDAVMQIARDMGFVPMNEEGHWIE
jgi:hypothetical protein